MTPSNPQFAAYIRDRRHELGLSLQQLAERLDVPKSRLHNYESGKFMPRPELLEPLAAALEVSYEDLFAISGLSLPEGLPAFTPYLRAKYRDLPDEAIAEAEAMFADWQKRHGAGKEGADAKPDH